MTYDDRRKEIRLTRFCVEADPLAAPLLPMTAAWLQDNETAREAQLAADDAEVRSDAFRWVANFHLDHEVRLFAADLEHDQVKNGTAPKKAQETTEFRQFFPVAPNVFVRLPLQDEASRVGAWLAGDSHPTLDGHRAGLKEWQGRSVEALAMTDASALVRGKSQVVRERHAESLTRSRDALWRALADLGEKNGMPRDWADGFFRQVSRAGAAAAGDETPGPTGPT